MHFGLKLSFIENVFKMKLNCGMICGQKQRIVGNVIELKLMLGAKFVSVGSVTIAVRGLVFGNECEVVDESFVCSCRK